MRGKQSIRKGVWHIGGETRRYIKRQRGKEIPFRLIASAATPFLGEVEFYSKHFLVIGVGEAEDERKNGTWSSCCSKTS